MYVKLLDPQEVADKVAEKSSLRKTGEKRKRTGRNKTKKDVWPCTNIPDFQEDAPRLAKRTRSRKRT